MTRSSAVPRPDLDLLVASTKDVLRDWGSVEGFQEDVGTLNL